MKNIVKYTFALSVFLATFSTSCDKNDDIPVFNAENDIALGDIINNGIAEDGSFNLLSTDNYPISYAYIQSMLEEILGSEEIVNREEFNWTITIIDDDQVLNAFVTPGGHLYVYTGLIYFLDKEDDLAGVLAHQVAQADLRHVSKNLQREYGVSSLLSISKGGQSSDLDRIIGQLSGTGVEFEFSRDNELEADDFSVRYLSSTSYACDGAADFFQKLLANEEQRQPEFLMSHPSPENRVEKINARALELGCDTSVDDNSVLRYQNFRNTLP